MNNEDFFQQFRQMFNDPEQRPVLVEYFEKCNEQLNEKSKPITVAVIGHYRDFYKAFEGLEELPNFDDEDCEKRKSGNLLLVNCSDEMDVYGKKFNFYTILEGEKGHTKEMFEAAAYLTGHNTPKILYRNLSKMIQHYSDSSNVGHA